MFNVFAEQLPKDQPVYGTRSLFLFEGKKRKDEQALALLFAKEVAVLAAGREIIVGGVCAGARIAFDAACQLRKDGVRVKMVFMHEAMPSQPIDVPVAIGYCETYHMSPFRRFHRPEILINKRCPAGWTIWTVPVDHEQVYEPKYLRGEMQKLQALWHDPSGYQTAVPMEQTLPQAYRARLACRLYPRLMGAGKRASLRVKITNLSNHTWMPGARSGLHLGHRWLDRNGLPCGDPGVSVPLPRAVPPGGSVSLTIKVDAPEQACRRLLEVDMVDEGIQWFSEKKSQHPSKPLRLKVSVLDRYSLGIFGKRPHPIPNP